MASLEEEDPVVREGPVVVHQELASSLHVLSFPLRPLTNPIDPPCAVRIKPHRRVLEYEYSVDTRSAHFDPRARGMSKLSRVKLKSSEVPLKHVQVAAVMRNGTMHLTPISAQHMMRPDMSHLESGVDTTLPTTNGGGTASSAPTKVQMQIRRAPGSDSKAEAYRRQSWSFISGQEESDPWVELSRASTGSASVAGQLVGAANNTAGTQGKESSSLPAGAAGRKKKSSAGVADDVEMEGGSSSSGSPLPATLSASEILRSLTVGTETREAVDVSIGAAREAAAAVSGSSYSTASSNLVASSGGQPITLAALERQPVAVQIEEGLRRAHVMPTPRLLELAVSASSLEDAIQVTDKLCRLVRGNWVLRSDVLYGPTWRERLQHIKAHEAKEEKGGAGAQSGQPRAASAGKHRGKGAGKLTANQLASRSAVRDYILCCFAFSTDACVNIDETASAMGVLPRLLLPVLTELGIRTAEGSRIWKFKRADDPGFAQRFPKVAEQAQRWWKRRDTELSQVFRERALTQPGAYGVKLAGRGYAADINSVARGTVGLAGSAGTELPEWLVETVSERLFAAGGTAALAAVIRPTASHDGETAAGGAGAASAASSGTSGRSSRGRAGSSSSSVSAGRGRSRSRTGSAADEGGADHESVVSIVSGVGGGDHADLHAIDARSAAELKHGSSLGPAARSSSSGAGGPGSGRKDNSTKGNVSFAAGTHHADGSRAAAAATASAGSSRAGGAPSTAQDEDERPQPHPTSSSLHAPVLALVARDPEGARIRDGMSSNHANMLTDMLKEWLRGAGVLSMDALLNRIAQSEDFPHVCELQAVVTAMAREELAASMPAPATGKSKSDIAKANAAKAQWDSAVASREEELTRAVVLATLSDFAARVPPPATDLFVVKNTGSPQADRYRPTVTHLLAEKGSKGVRKADVIAAVKLAVGDEDIPAQLYAKLMKELAVSTNNLWRLKDGNLDGAGPDAAGAAEGDEA